MSGTDPFDLHDELLLALFERSKAKANGFVKLRHIQFVAGPLSGMEANFLDRLKAKDLVDLRFPNRERFKYGLPNLTAWMEPEQEYQISLSGISHVLQELEDPESYTSRVRSGQIERRVKVNGSHPTVVATRVIESSRNEATLGDLTAEVEEMRGALDKLQTALVEGNDLGNLTEEERDQAVENMKIFRALLDDLSLTIAYIQMKANELLAWVVDKSAGALVGEAAKHLFKIIAKANGY